MAVSDDDGPNHLWRAVIGGSTVTVPSTPCRSEEEGTQPKTIEQPSSSKTDHSRSTAHTAHTTTTKTPSARPLSLLTTTGEVIECDFIVSATGVQPNTSFLQAQAYSTGSSEKVGNNVLEHGLEPVSEKSKIPHFVGSGCSDGSSDSSSGSIPIHTTAEGYIIVDEKFRSSVQDVYAAGDCCSYQPSSEARSKYFFQMRLWTQARLMGLYTAQCMLGQVVSSYHWSSIIGHL